MSPFSDILKPGLRFRPKTRQGPRVGKAAEPAVAADVTAEIRIGADGWRLRLRGRESEILSPDQNGRVRLPLELRDASELLKQIGEAIAVIGSEERRRLGAIDLVVSDPQIEILDNRLIRGGMSDRESAARLAREVLGREESAFDVCAFGVQNDNDQDRKIIAAMPLDRVRDYLAAAGDLAMRVRCVTPSAADVIAEASAAAGEMAGAIEIGARHTQIVLAEGASGAIVQRVIPLGTVDLAQKLAEVQSLPGADAMQMLAERDMFRRQGRDGRQGRSEGAVIGVAERLAADLAQTIEDFAENRLAAPPSRIALSGCVDEVSGLADWLRGRIGVELTEPADRPRIEGPPPLNLLRGTAEPLIVQGRTRYRFRDEAFVPMEDGETAPKSPIRLNDDGPAPGKRRGRTSGKTENKPDNTARNRRALIMAGVAGTGLLAFVAWENLLAPAVAKTQRNANALSVTVDRTLSMRTRLNALLEEHARDLRVRSQASNKILWTEKFLAISDAMPPGLWLTDTTIIHDERSVGTTDVITTKLKIRGRTMLDDREHLSEVSRFIQRLEGDPRFMSDFRQITFEGMAPVDGRVIAFEVHAWYDENKRKRAAEAEREGAGGAIDGLKRKTDERNQIQDQILNFGPASPGAGE